MTNLVRNQYLMLAVYAQTNLTVGQIFNLSRWLATYNSNYNASKFLLACGLTPDQIAAHFQKDAA